MCADPAVSIRFLLNIPLNPPSNSGSAVTSHFKEAEAPTPTGGGFFKGNRIFSSDSSV